jgi:hypothetical protein
VEYIRYKIFSFCQLGRYSAKLEKCVGDKKLRPGDVSIENWQIGKTAELDISVKNCTTTRVLAQASQKRGFAAATKEEEKKKKYDQICAQSNALFYPIIVENHGCWGQLAIPVLKQLAKAMSIHQDLSTSVAVNTIFQDLSLILQKSNARMIMTHPNCLGEFFDARI